MFSSLEKRIFTISNHNYWYGLNYKLKTRKYSSKITVDWIDYLLLFTRIIKKDYSKTCHWPIAVQW